MTPFFLYPFPSPKCTSEVWDQMLTSFILPILQTISDGGGGRFLQAHRTNKSRIRLAFSWLAFFPVITGLCSICTAQLFRLGSFHGPLRRRWSIWRGCRCSEEVFHCHLSPCLTGSSDDTSWESFTLVEPACLSVSQLEVVFFTSWEILEWRGAFLQTCIEQDSSFLTLRFSCDVSLYWCIFKIHH